MIVKSAAIRKRKYAGKESAIEVRKDEYSNCIDSLASKDCLIIIIRKENFKNE